MFLISLALYHLLKNLKAYTGFIILKTSNKRAPARNIEEIGE